MTRPRRLLQPALVCVALLFIALLLRGQWQQLQQHQWRLQPGWLGVSALLLVGSWFVEVAMWRMLLSALDRELPFAAAVQIWFASILVRYVPGNVWQPLGMTVLARERGVRPEATVLSIALYQALNLLSIAPLIGLYLLLAPNTVLPTTANLPLWMPAALVVPVLILVVRPAWLIGLVNGLLHRLGRQTLAAQLGSGLVLRLLCVAVGDWLLWGSAFAALVFALAPPPAPLELTSHLLVAYPVAYALGYLSFLTPGGLAVREGVLVLLLTPVLGVLATVAALAMRLWQVAWEVVVAGAVALWARRSGPLASAAAGE